MRSFAQALSLAAAGLSLSFASPTPAVSPRQTGSKNLIVFGDSYSTVGFWPGGTLPAAGNPLGNPALPGQTTSSGLNWVGHLTGTLNTSLVLTYDFAVTGATTDKDIVNTYAQFCVDDQVAQYAQYASAKVDKANALVAVWIGINDVGEPFWAKQPAPVARIMDRYFELLQTLADDGLANFVLLTVPPFSDQIPAIIDQPEVDRARLRSDIAAYNAALETRLAAFKPRKQSSPASTRSGVALDLHRSRENTDGLIVCMNQNTADGACLSRRLWPQAIDARVRSAFLRAEPVEEALPEVDLL
ncbi:hypothetical protein CTA1_8529 [Colletotrichum tanaceti]|uniref:Uncharacterized protein n=1 Tax=Colletotrichum tanaceti TaxID=1306861 RepID=A0A4U6XNX3_9PEZI|nr:hypothetical protein CTA1_8529 [Colletotrichum tanaceti]